MKSMRSGPVDFRRITAAEFARMSRSLQHTLLVIRRAQLASKKVIAATPDWSRYGKQRPRATDTTAAPQDRSLTPRE